MKTINFLRTARHLIPVILRRNATAKICVAAKDDGNGMPQVYEKADPFWWGFVAVSEDFDSGMLGIKVDSDCECPLGRTDSRSKRWLGFKFPGCDMDEVLQQMAVIALRIKEVPEDESA
ncbi:MAG: hypothetical protein Q8O94_02905 [bacterium]|nr:hypothetical protein [bacterium]